MSSLKDYLLEGHRSSIGFADELSRSALENPKLIDSIIGLVLKEENAKIRSRAMHALMQISKKKPKLLFPFKDTFLNKIAFIDQWEVKEQVVKILPIFSLSKSDIEKAFKIFKNYLKDSHAFARVYALQGLYDLTLIDSSLIPTVQSIIHDQMNFDKASIQARGRKLLKLLEK